MRVYSGGQHIPRHKCLGLRDETVRVEVFRVQGLGFRV